jgi:hypothetical protein
VDPALVIRGEATGRNHAMEMGMMFQLLIPTVEHAEEADFGAEMAGITCHFEQCFSTGLEQQTVDHLLVLQSHGGEPARKGENDMDVGGGQEFSATGLQPTVTGVRLTLGAVPIPTGIV